MSVKMLLRSRSTLLLSSFNGGALVASLHHSPASVREVDREKNSVESPCHGPRLTRCVSFTNAALASAATSPLTHPGGVTDDTRSVDRSEWDFCGDIVPWPTFRRAQSEGDLESLSRGSSALLATAESLVASPSGKGSREDVRGSKNLSTVQRQWSRRMSIQPSLSAIASNSDSSDSDDSQDAGLFTDVSEALESEILGTGISQEEPDCGSGDGSEEVGDEALRGCGTEHSSLNSTNLQVAAREEIEAGAPDSLESEFRLASDGNKRHPATKVASMSRRDGAASYYEAGDGERYSSVACAANGTVVICNSRGCKPVGQSDLVGPMFIAGGFGMGGGGGGRNVGVATDGGGGRGDSVGRDAYYKRALEANPGHPLLLRNYAKFLHEVKRDTTKAESFYERAILANPGDGELLGLYANLIWDVYKDEERAGSYFDQAVQASPDNCYVGAAYASFLWAVDGVEEAQEKPMDLGGHCNGLEPSVPSRYSF